MDGSLVEPEQLDVSCVLAMRDSVLEPEPSSPVSAPVRLTSCLEELLRFTLSASLLDDSDVPLGLSRDYCQNLLKEDPLPSLSQISMMEMGGVPPYPLYKHLARALEGCIRSGSFSIERRSVKGIRESEFLELKQSEWDRLIVEYGVELVNMLGDVDFELNVQEPFFSQLRNGMKTVEGRCAIGDYNNISSGSLLLFNGSLLLKVQDVRHYSSFSKMLEVELADALPGVLTVEDGVLIYRKFYTEQKEKSNGVLAIHVLKGTSQPYIPLGHLLSGLGYEGIGFLVGMRFSTGTVPDALPPPRSHLLSSFMQLHLSNVVP